MVALVQISVHRQIPNISAAMDDRDCLLALYTRGWGRGVGGRGVGGGDGSIVY